MPSLQDYYDQCKTASIERVVEQLEPGQFSGHSGSQPTLKCPGGHPDYPKALTLFPSQCRFWCFVCGKGGDAIDLAQSLMTQALVGAGERVNPETHRRARDLVGNLVGLEPWRGEEKMDKAVFKHREERAQLQRALGQFISDGSAALLGNPEALQWLEDQYTIQPEAVKKWGLGLATKEVLEKHDRGQASSLLRRSGISLGKGNSKFENRLIIPYKQAEETVYIKARSTPWSRTSEESPKYLGLTTVKSPHLENQFLLERPACFNENRLWNAKEFLVLVEGEMDCIALEERGIPSVAFGSLRLPDPKHKRFYDQLHKIPKKYLCLDRDPANTGQGAVLPEAKKLLELGMAARIIAFPSEDDAKKTDGCEFFRAGNTVGDFQSLLKVAKHPVTFQMDQLVSPADPEEARRVILPTLELIALTPLAEHSGWLNSLRAKVSPHLNSEALRAELSQFLPSQEPEGDQGIPGSFQGSTVEGELICELNGAQYFSEGTKVIEQKWVSRGAGFEPRKKDISHFLIRINCEECWENPLREGKGDSLLVGMIQLGEEEIPFEILAQDWLTDTAFSQAIARSAGDRAWVDRKSLDVFRQVITRLSDGRPRRYFTEYFGTHPEHGFLSRSLAIQGGRITLADQHTCQMKLRRNHPKLANFNLLQGSAEEVAILVKIVLEDLLFVHLPQITTLLLGHTFCGVVFDTLGLGTRGFALYTLWFHGSSGQGKTELARLFQCFFGDFRNKDGLLAWGSTLTAVREQAALIRGALVVVDDYKQRKVPAKLVMNLLGDVYDAQGRDRGTSKGEVLPGTPIKCPLLITGEDLVDSDTAVLARLLPVSIQSGKDEEKWLLALESQSEISKVTTAFIAWLQRQDRSRLAQEAQNLRFELVKRYRKEFPTHDNLDRVLCSGALNAFTFHLFLEFAQEMGGVLKNYADSLRSIHSAALDDLLKGHLQGVDQARPALIFLKYLRQILSTNQGRVLDHFNAASLLQSPKPIGYRHPQGKLLLYPEATMALIRSEYQKAEGEPFPFPNSTVAQQLAQNGFLERKNQKGYQSKCRIPGAGAEVPPDNFWILWESKIGLKSGLDTEQLGEGNE